jgi:NAD(P)-dependent dehydrogenase (short-subunit alcohol dehydrogenase family)
LPSVSSPRWRVRGARYSSRRSDGGNSLSETTVLITGGATGIGRAAARAFAAQGSRVSLVDVDEAEGRATAAEVDGLFVRADVSDSTELHEAFGRVKAEVGPIGVVLLNAGILSSDRDIATLTDESYRRVLGVNVDGVVFGIREAVNAMSDAGGGSIVATASMAGLHPFARDPIYTLTKHAVVGLVRALAPPLAEQQITINCICPGLVDTGLASGPGRGRNLPRISPEAVADAMVRVAGAGVTGEAWVFGPDGLPSPHQFPPVPRRRFGRLSKEQREAPLTRKADGT